MSDRHVTSSQAQLTLANVRPRSPSEALQPKRAPARPKGARIRRERPRVNAFVRWLSGIFTLLFLAAVGTRGTAAYLAYAYDAAGPLSVTRIVAVPKGEGRIAIAARLEREGVIANRWIFVASHLYQSWGNKAGYDLKAGEYEIRRGASMRQVLNTLVEGRSILQKVTVPEGLTSQQIVARLQADPNLVGELTSIPEEGSLLPETYKFSRGMTRQEVVEQMQSERKRILADLWRTRQPGLPIETPEQALILASIIEKETGRADERARVAAVFINRLRKGMRLQSDPTIIYGIVGGQGTLGRPITRSDIDTKTAYNTYQINGLPPGPICNPGRDAIQATLNPAKTDDLFFVADGTGGHAFTQNLRDHNAAVAQWRRIERAMRERQAAEKAAEPALPGKPVSQSAAAAPSGPPPTAPIALNAASATPATAPSEGVPLPIRRPRAPTR